MAGRLYRMAKVVSANPASWGIVDANQISGFRTVATQADLYSIAACILSSSYGDGTTTGADAVGQIWHVQDANKDFRLTSWANRGKAAGWTVVDYADAATVGDRLTKVETKATTNANNIGKLNTTVSEHTQSIEENSNRIVELRNNKADHSEVTAVDDKLTAFKNTKGQAKGIASLGDDGKVPMDQLPLIDNTLYELVDVLPSTLAKINKNHIYLVKATTTGTNNVYAEYIYTGTSATYDATKWEKLGEVTASVDLSGYYTKAEIDKKVTAINKNSISSLFVGKQDPTDAISVVLKRAGGENTLSAPIPVVNNDLDDHHNGLMSPTMLTKLNGIATGANNYTHPVHTAYDSGLYKITVDSLGHVSAATLVDKADIKSLAPDLTVTQTGSELTQDIKITYNGADHIARLLSATDKQAGLLSSANKKKLDGIAEGATKNIVDGEVKINGANAVSGKAVWNHVYNYKIHGDNVGNEVNGTSYTIVARNDDSNTVDCLTDALTLNYDATNHSILVVDNAIVWDEVTLKAISNTELTKILV